MATDIYCGASYAWLDLISCAEQAALWAIDGTKQATEVRVAHLMYYEWGAKSVLDLGCGVGRYALALPHERYVGIDQSLPMITVAEAKVGADPRVTLIRANAESLQLRGTFDLGIAMHVTQHLVDPVSWLKRVIEAYNCKRWCFTVLVASGDIQEVFNIGPREAACARPLHEAEALVREVGLNIEHMEFEGAVGVKDAREMIVWGVL